MEKWSPRLIIFLGLIFVAVSFMLPDPEENGNGYSLPTGIILDSMENEVFIVYKDKKPVEFYSDIFTPVCNTGECLPVSIIIYWDLNGRYDRYEMPDGEILTKLDHVPFTDDDYDLLDEILRREADPRSKVFKDHIAEPVKHNDEGDVSYSSPAPGASSKFEFMDKHDMVDGVTGSTLPEQKEKFVPGALYTSYTLWGLANDPAKLMLEFGQENLFTKYANYLLLKGNRELRSDIIQYLADQHEETNGRANMLATYIDTCNIDRFPKLVPILIKQVYFKHAGLDTICYAQHHAFFRTDNALVKEELMLKWMASPTCDYILSDIASYLMIDQTLMSPAVDMFDNKSAWPNDVAQKLILTAKKMESNSIYSDKAYLVQMMLDNASKLTTDQYQEVRIMGDEIGLK